MQHVGCSNVQCTGDDKEFACFTCKNEKTPRSVEAAQMYKCEGLLCNGVKRPFYHFVQDDLSAWILKDTLQEATCARCAMKDAADNVTFRCAACKATRHVSCFNPVTIRNWKDKKKGVEAHWMCYDCLHPQCGMCDTEAVYAVVHNSKAHNQDLFKHVREHSEAKTLIEARLKKHANDKFEQGQAV